MRKISMIALMIGLFALTTPLFAHSHKKECSTSEHESCERREKSCSKCPIANAIMKASCFLTKNASEIGLNDEQLKKIKSIAMETKKEAILGQAQMKVMCMDLSSKLCEEKLDVEGINAMIDQGSAGWAAAGKKTLKNYADLRAILTPEQMAKAKELCKKSHCK